MLWAKIFLAVHWFLPQNNFWLVSSRRLIFCWNWLPNNVIFFEGALTISLYTIKAVFFEAILSWNDRIQTTSQEFYGDQAKIMTTRACVCLLVLTTAQILSMDLLKCKPSKSTSLKPPRCRPGVAYCPRNGLDGLQDDRIFNSKVNFTR